MRLLKPGNLLRDRTGRVWCIIEIEQGLVELCSGFSRLIVRADAIPDYFRKAACDA